MQLAFNTGPLGCDFRGRNETDSVIDGRRKGRATKFLSGSAMGEERVRQLQQ